MDKGKRSISDMEAGSTPQATVQKGEKQRPQIPPSISTRVPASFVTISPKEFIRLLQQDIVEAKRRKGIDNVTPKESSKDVSTPTEPTASASTSSPCPSASAPSASTPPALQTQTASDSTPSALQTPTVSVSTPSALKALASALKMTTSSKDFSERLRTNEFKMMTELNDPTHCWCPQGCGTGCSCSKLDLPCEYGCSCRDVCESRKTKRDSSDTKVLKDLLSRRKLLPLQ